MATISGLFNEKQILDTFRDVLFPKKYTHFFRCREKNRLKTVSNKNDLTLTLRGIPTTVVPCPHDHSRLTLARAQVRWHMGQGLGSQLEGQVQVRPTPL